MLVIIMWDPQVEIQMNLLQNVTEPAVLLTEFWTNPLTVFCPTVFWKLPPAMLPPIRSGQSLGYTYFPYCIYPGNPFLYNQGARLVTFIMHIHVQCNTRNRKLAVAYFILCLGHLSWGLGILSLRNSSSIDID